MTIAVDLGRKATNKSLIKRKLKLRLARKEITFYIIETPFDTFANRADQDQVALVRAA